MSNEHCVLSGTLGNVSNSSCQPLGRTNRILVDPTGTFSFATQNDITVANIKTAICNKELYAFPLIETEESADVEPVFEELANSRPKVTERKRTTNWTSLVPACIHKNMRSFDNRKVRIFEITESNFVKSVDQSDGSQKGQAGLLTVDLQTLADSSVSAKSPYSFRYIGTEYDQNPADTQLDGPHEDIQGIVDVTIEEILTSTTSLLNVQVKKICNGESVTNLVLADFEVLDAGGSPVTVTSATFVPANDAYELASAAAFANGDTVGLDGVIDQPEICLESPETDTISTI